MRGRFVWFGCIGVVAVYGCAGEHFDEECPAGTVKLGTQCVVPAAGAAAAAGAAGAAGAAAGKGGASGTGGESGAGQGGLGGNAGTGGAGAAGAGGAGTTGGGAAGSGAGGGVAGAAGSGGKAGAAAGFSGAGGGMAGASGTAGSGMAGKGGNAGTAGTAGAAGASAGSGGAGTGGVGGSSAGSGGAGAAGSAGDAGSGGAAGAGGSCNPSACTADECYVPTCDGTNCSQAFADAGTTCGTNGVCTGKGVCGECKPGNQDCSGKTPRTCGEDGKWVEGTACDIACTGAGVCSTVTAITGGINHVCALMSDTTARCWGSSNSQGQLGTDAPPSTGTALVKDLADATSVAAGGDFSCARKADGTVWCWGTNGSGQLGIDVLTQSSSVPVQVPGVSTATAVFAGPRASGACATLADTSVVCWGSGQPVAAVAGLTAVTAVTVGEQFHCARTSVGALWCWGRNSEGQCADGTVGGPNIAAPKLAFSGVKSVFAGRQFACSLSNSNQVHCWGSDQQGQIGNGLPKADVGSPQLTMFNGITLAVGGYHGCATAAGGLSCWGDAVSSSSPVALSNVGTPLQIVSLGSDSLDCGVFGPTDVRCWAGDTSPTPVEW